MKRAQSFVHGGDEGMAEHGRVRPGDPHASSFGQAPRVLSRIGSLERAAMDR